MSINSSSPSNVSTPFFYVDCRDSFSSMIIYTLYTAVSVLLLLPLYVFVICAGFRRSRRRRVTSARATTSHSDFFTYHMMVVEILSVLGSFCYTLGSFLICSTLTFIGVYGFHITFPGQTMFHVLASVECYLAVVHPVTYMHLREASGIRMRNVSVLCAWGLCFGWVGVSQLYLPSFPTIPFLCFTSVCIFITSFCCLSVLYVLTRPGPGKVGSPKVDQSKQRAFYMIVAINTVLLLRFLGLLVCFGLTEMVQMDQEDLCALMDSGLWLTVPSSLLLPLLFLHRAGKLSFCKKSRVDQDGG